MNSRDLGTIIADATMNAAVEILHQRGKSSSDIDLDALVEALRTEAKAAAKCFLSDGKVLLDSGRSLWLETLLKTECVAAAKAAVDAVSGVAA